MKGKHFLKLLDLTPAQIENLLELANSGFRPAAEDPIHIG